MKNLADTLLSVTQRVEIYVDLYGFSLGWVEKIQEDIPKLYRCRSGDECECYFCPEAGGVGVKFITDPEYAPVVEAEIRRLLALAARTYKKLP